MQKRSSFLIATVIASTLLQACSGSNSAEEASDDGAAATADAATVAAGEEPGESLAFEWSANGFEQLPAQYKWTGSGRRDEGFEPNFSLSVPETDDVIWSSGCMAGGKVKTVIYFTPPEKMQGNRATLRFETDKSPRTLEYTARYVADGQMDGFELVQSAQDPMFAEMRAGTWAYVHVGEGTDGTKLRIALNGAARGLGAFLPACSGAKKVATAPKSAPVLYACDDGRGVKATYMGNDTDTPVVRVEVDGQVHLLSSAVSGSGALYESDGDKKRSWHTKAKDGVWQESAADGSNEVSTNCREVQRRPFE